MNHDARQMSTSAPSNRPSLNDLRVLATMLPPSERVFGAEAADLVSAIANVVAHGPGIVEASKQGVQGLYDFFHDVQVKNAEAQGVDAPQKGNPVHTEQVAPVGTPAQPAAIDYDKLAAAIVKAQSAGENVTPVSTSVADPTPPASDTPPTQNETEGLL